VYIGMPRSRRSPSKVVSCTFLLHELPAEGCLYNCILSENAYITVECMPSKNAYIRLHAKQICIE
jgi:hypothetical protein